MKKRDYYEVLGVARTASPEEIKAAFRKLASRYHPDKVTGEVEKKVAEEKFKEIKEAYDYLTTQPARESADDKYRHYSSAARNSNEYRDINIDDLLDEFMHTYGQEFRDHQEEVKKHAQHQELTISLADAYNGTTVAVSSTHRIRIPRGIRSDTKLYADGKIYKITVAANAKFKRSGDDLLVDITISAIEAMLGVAVQLEHLSGNKLQFNIPAGIQPGQIVKLAGKGMQNPEIDKSGDVLVRISVSIPKTLSDAERAAVEAMQHRDTIDL